MPAENGVVSKARMDLGLDMPTLEAQFEEYKEKQENEARDRYEHLLASRSPLLSPPSEHRQAGRHCARVRLLLCWLRPLLSSRDLLPVRLVRTLGTHFMGAASDYWVPRNLPRRLASMRSRSSRSRVCHRTTQHLPVALSKMTQLILWMPSKGSDLI